MQKKIIAGSLLFAASLLLLSPTVAVFAIGPVTLGGYYGTGTLTSFQSNPAVELSSFSCTIGPNCPYGETYGGIFFDTPGYTLGDFSTLGTQYYVNQGNCYGGAPRIDLWLDKQGSSEIAVYLSGNDITTPGCTTGSWQSTGNLAGVSSNNPTSNYVCQGNTCYSWADALTNFGSTTHVYNVSIDVDAGWSTQNAPGQDIFFKAITINDYTFPSTSGQVGVPQFPLGFALVLALAVPLFFMIRARLNPSLGPR